MTVTKNPTNFSGGSVNETLKGIGIGILVALFVFAPIGGVFVTLYEPIEYNVYTNYNKYVSSDNITVFYKIRPIIDEFYVNKIEINGHTILVNQQVKKADTYRNYFVLNASEIINDSFESIIYADINGKQKNVKTTNWIEIY